MIFFFETNGKKITFLEKKNSWAAYKNNFELKTLELLEYHVKTSLRGVGHVFSL